MEEVLEQAVDQTEDVELESEQPASIDVADDTTDVDERSEWLKTLDVDQILALHPGLKKRIANLVGNHAQKQAKEIVARELPELTAKLQSELIADLRHAAAYDQLERLRKTDQFTFAEEMQKTDMAAIWMQGRQRQAQAPHGTPARPPEHVRWEETVMQAKLGRISKEAQTAFEKGKQYDESPEGRAAFEADADAVWLEEQIAASLGTREKATAKRTAAEKLDALADDADEVPEIGSGRPSGGAMTMQKYEGLSVMQKRNYRKNNPSEYDRMINRAYART